MVSDADLVTQLRDILAGSDLDTTTPSAVRRQLEDFFGVDLSDKKAFIRDQIDAFLESSAAAAAAEPEEEEGDEEPEEERSNKEEKVKKRTGFNKLCSLSPKLQEFSGEKEMSRPEVVKKLWSYIREKNLQDPKNKRNILCDEPLRALFRVNTINMFQMNKALTKHIWPLSTEDEYVNYKKKAEERDDSESGSNKSEKQEVEEEDEVVKVKASRKRKAKSTKADKSVVKKRAGGGFTKLCSLSPQLQSFTGEAQLARTEVVKRLWCYIRENSLQDPANKRVILCDDPLRTLFEVDSINMFQMNKALTKHIWPLNPSDEIIKKEKSPPPMAKQCKEEEQELEEDEEEDEEEEEEEEEEDEKGSIQ